MVQLQTSLVKKFNTIGDFKMYPAIDNDMTILFNKDIIAMKKNGSIINIIYPTTTIVMRYDKLDICNTEYCRIAEWIEGAS